MCLAGINTYWQYSQDLYHFGGNLNARYLLLSNFIVGC